MQQTKVHCTPDFALADYSCASGVYVTMTRSLGFKKAKRDHCIQLELRILSMEDQLKSFISTLPVPRSTMGMIAGSGLKLCILWYSVWLCQVDALIRRTPLYWSCPAP